MATIKQGILGGFSGKVANVIGSSWKGIAVMKSKPLSVANPKTAGQTSQRDKFGGVVAFATAILSTIIKPLWDRFASQMSGYNDFVSTNLALFANGVLTTPASLVISKGKMSATVIDSATLDASEHMLSLSWSNDAGQGFKLASDKVFVVFYNKTKDEFSIYDGSAVRSDGNVVLDGLDWASPDQIYAYLAFRRVDGTIVSNSSYSPVSII